MTKYILSLVLLILVLIFTIINMIGQYASFVEINFLFFRTPAIPAVILLYMGMILGSILTIPVILSSKKVANAKATNTTAKAKGLDLNNKQDTKKEVKKDMGDKSAI